MNLPTGLLDRLAVWQDRLQQTYPVRAFERVQTYISSLSGGDKFIAYTLVALIGLASLLSLYALEQSLLVAQPAYGGSLVEGEVGSPRFINPLLAISDADRDLSTLTYAGLMGLSGSGALVPVLAERYEISPDGKTYTFFLRSGLTFSDGSALTADDVVFTVEKTQVSAIKSPQYANWSGVRVAALDPQTVQFTLAKPYAPFLELTTLGILPKHLWKNLPDERFAFSPLQTAPVGAGPFKIKDVSFDSSRIIQSITMVENSSYALGRPYLDSIRFEFYTRGEDLASALADGSVQSAYDVPIKRQNTTTLTAPYARVFAVFWNQNEKQVYTRQEVRRALSLAINRQAIVKNVLGGYATPIMGPVPPSNTITQVAVPSTASPTQAAADVLEHAGWTYDSTARHWSNKKAKTTLDGITLRTSNVPELKKVAAAIKTDWEALGIPVNIELYEPGDLSQNIIRPRKYEALLYGMVIGRDQDLYAFWDSHERNDPGLNVALYANKTVDALLEDARSNTDPTARAADLQKIEDTVAADYPAAFIYAPDFTYAVPASLKGVSLPQIVTPADRFAGVTSWYEVTDAAWPFFATQ
ncbi:hypothetical protein COU19_00345 [Candidatus Kaiserbacteria bacterium CG10_big_fil_rev_8_21_14_0_10_56_12]|uniref:Solute-binding protein family 5 domain-containing protein n=1 Tax=Candidatus Kaiserbacteria bacterium CG10_big_fil_rev_8_21_14_0_10_56_12 TaxID=1974611 RepID=A0A2H0UAL0_9BACT|nr:MAG: hypothetical protein COU19_00345 [Candidatus Kaiserbacteria bacterium CG10_big_fil_rev_8_21_14_0_10_56_12]